MQCDLVVATIFVNPTQFGPQEDFAKYPRTLERDLDLLAGAQAEFVFTPTVEEMYPAHDQTRVRVPRLAEGLCGAVRPGHFEGVATVVAKFFNAIGPGAYFFGKKDYQQWRVIERMASDLLFPLRVVGCPIVREADGLAMSSRNSYLSAEERALAPRLAAALRSARSRYQGGERNLAALLDHTQTELRAARNQALRFEVEYVEIRVGATLEVPAVDAQGLLDPGHGELVLLVAARLGTTRLIDNLEL
jgi:pantoate--beta-alanine ligase